MAKPPVSLPPTSASRPLRFTLFLGSFTYSPASIPLFDVYLPEASPPAVDTSFAPQPEIQHTFRAPQKVPNAVFPLVFSAVALAPWALLAVLVREKSLIPLSFPRLHLSHLALSSYHPLAKPFSPNYPPLYRSPRRVRRTPGLVLGRIEIGRCPPLRWSVGFVYRHRWQESSEGSEPRTVSSSVQVNQKGIFLCLYCDPFYSGIVETT